MATDGTGLKVLVPGLPAAHSWQRLNLQVNIARQRVNASGSRLSLVRESIDHRRHRPADEEPPLLVEVDGVARAQVIDSSTPSRIGATMRLCGLWTLVGIGLFGAACGPRTVGEACDGVCEGACSRLAACGSFPQSQEASCNTACVNSCCVTSGACQLLVRSPDAVLRCESALPNTACATLGGGNLPGVCVGVASP